MVLGIIGTLCGICDRLLRVALAQQEELRRLNCDDQILLAWEREIKHLSELLAKAKR